MVYDALRGTNIVDTATIFSAEKSLSNYTSHSRRTSVKKVKFSRYRPGVAQRVGKGIALLFHDRGTRSG